MNKKLLIVPFAAAVAVAITACLGPAAKTCADPAQYVNPYVGGAFNGHCFAAAAYPFGLVQAGPDTTKAGDRFFFDKYDFSK